MDKIGKQADLKGQEIYSWAKDLFPICRSLTGQGFRETLQYFMDIVPEMKMFEVRSGSKVFDWEVPNEWNITEAYIADENGDTIIDFKLNNLHVVGYSDAVDEWLDLEDLQANLHSLPDQPEAIPYVTSYYERKWGFCMSHKQREALKSGRYHAVIKSTLEPGFLNYGELLIPGESKKEIFLSSYICHPSMANNELSGPTVLTAIAQWLQDQKSLKYSYRLIFIPETIGSITYLSKNLEVLKDHVIAGYNISCIGDDGAYSYVPSRLGSTLSDRVANHVLRNMDNVFTAYSWLDRGSDERQYCSPGVDLPVVGFSRSKYGEYPEYHTSLDNLNFISPKGLAGSYLALIRMIEVIENDVSYISTTLCEPQLGKRGLYPTLSQKGSTSTTKPMMNFISYCDGTKSLLEISDIIGIPFWDLLASATKLLSHGIIEEHKP
jgi:aminopeptidase-like protein